MTSIDNQELQRARQIIENTNMHLFLTGKAGTGKTTFLRNLKKQSPKRMIVVAPTGIAAINAEGVTIHSFFQLPFAPFVPDTTFSSSQSHFRFGKEKIKIIRSMDLLVIDEISMVRADLLDAIDSVLRRYRDRYKPFGGVQLLMIGDLQQLAPVVKDSEWSMLKEYYNTAYFFGSRALQQTSYATIELKQVYRQSDPYFLSILNKVRENKADESTLNELNKRYIPQFQPSKEEGYIRLTTHNYQAQLINDHELAQLPGRTFSYNADIDGVFPEYSYPTEKVLTLKQGAQIMFVKNDHTPEKRYYNGMIGEICEIDSNGFYVRTKEYEERIKVEPEEWANSKYVLNEETKEITEQTEGIFKQYPVKLAWAITIHKSQGLTFEHAIIDAQSSFAHGQAYVALSRCKTLEGMVLSSQLSANAIISDSTVDTYTHDIEKHTPSEESIKALQREYFLSLVSELFDFSLVARCFNEQVRLLDEHFYKLFPQLLNEYKEQIKVFAKKITDVSYRFHNQYDRLVTQHTDYDTNEELQTRIRKGAEYFEQELQPFYELAEKTSLPTDNKELKKKAITTIENFEEALHQKLQLLKYIKYNGFQINDYLKQKAYILLDETDNGATSNKKEKKERSTKERKVIEVSTDILHSVLYSRLTEWRTAKAKEENLPAYCIAQQRALIGIANLMPHDAKTLEAIPYFGAKGVKKYGAEILNIIVNYAKEYGLLQQKVKTPEEEKKAKELTFQLHKEGKSLKEISQIQQLSKSTLLEYLTPHIISGEIKIEEFTSLDKVNRILDYTRNNKVGEQARLLFIKRAMPADITFEDIQLVIDVYKVFK